MSLQITHPAQERLAIPLGSTYPALFEQWCGFFYVPQEPDKCKCSSLSETRKSNLFCRCHYKGSTFPQLFKDPECLSGRGLNPRPPAQQTGALPTKLTRCGCFCRFFSLTEEKAVAWILLLDPPPPPSSSLLLFCVSAQFLIFFLLLFRVLLASCEAWRSLERCPDVDQSGE